MRKARGHLPAGTYHTTLRSAGPIPIFVDDVENTYFCMLLRRVAKRWRWIVRQFCLMPTHYHLLVETPENTLQPGMQALNGSFANEFNRRRRRKGHLKGKRYYSVLVENDQHMLAVVRYIARNPVEDGLCAKPRDWRWGSYRGTAGYDDGFPFVDATPIRAYFGDTDEKINAELRAFVGDD